MQRIRHYYENFTHCNQMKYDMQEAINDEVLLQVNIALKIF